MIRKQNHLIPAKTILRDAGMAIVRTPLLWFFSTIYLLTNDLPTMIQNTSTWFGCLSFLLIPIAILAEAGQIRSIQLQQEGITTSASQVIKHVARRLGLLIVVLVIYILLYIMLFGVIRFAATLLLSQVPIGDMRIPILTISTVIAYPFMVFAQCAILISDLPLKSSLPMVFRVLKKDTFTILALVTIFGVLRYFFSVIYPTVDTNSFRIAGYMLVLLIMDGVQTAFFTIAYLQYIREATTIEPAQSPQLPDTDVYKSNQAQVARPKLWLLITLGIVSGQLTNFIIYGIIIFSGLGKTFNHGDGYIYALDLATMFNAMIGIILGALFGPLFGIIFFKITRNKILVLIGAFLGGVIPIILLWINL